MRTLKRSELMQPLLRLILSAMLLTVFGATLLGQANSPARPANQPAAEEVKAEADPAPRYTALDRRDPFQNLANLQVKPPPPRIIGPPPLAQRPPGLGGLLISEVSVIGMAQQSGRKIVVLRGTDQFTYMAREGIKLYDGVLESIKGDEVTFERTVQDTAGNKISSKVVKR